MMVSKKEIEERIYASVLQLVGMAEDTPDNPTLLHLVKTAFDSFCAVTPNIRDTEINIQVIAERLKRSVSVTTGGFSVIAGDDEYQHREWLSDRRVELAEAPRWNNFKRYQQKSLPETVLRELNNSTDYILSRLEDPRREGIWDVRGLVIGDVQSGKTTNFIALINKALDAGYKFIVVLSGLHNNLRLQTQERIENGVTGLNTKGDLYKPCGVGGVGFEQTPALSSLTIRKLKGDYLRRRAGGYAVENAISINKKNKRVLEQIIDFVKGKFSLGENQLTDVPFLLIDDECDHASINTKAMGGPPSAINDLVTKLLSLFSKSAYVGYTATPFATILVNPRDNEDIFPRNFIMTLGRSSNYIGPNRVFGEIEQVSTEEDGILRYKLSPELDWYISLDGSPYHVDWSDFVPDRHKKDHIISELPESLKDAITAFVIGISIRNLRGDGSAHKTMLIHVTRFQLVQNQIREFVDQFVEEFFDEMMSTGMTSSPNSSDRRLRTVFDQQYAVNGDPEVTWDEVRNEAKEALSTLKGNVYSINNTNKDLIDEDEYPHGLNSIRIGGDKLSRGLTLPGLMTSYFLRASRMYDTLMQMGRWFGYRDGYEDLCRLYTTSTLFNRYAHIALASEELRERLEAMRASNLTPLEYQQQIRTHPGVMMVTALNKRRAAYTMQVGFSASLAMVTAFDLSAEGRKMNDRNQKNIVDFIAGLGEPETESRHIIFKNIPADQVIEFVNSFETIKHCGNFDKKPLTNYIRKLKPKNELTDWTVVLFSTSFTDRKKVSVGRYTVRTLSRKLIPNDLTLRRVETSRRALVSLGDEKLGLTDEELENLGEDLPDGSGRTISREDIRRARSAERGLLLIYHMEPKNLKTDDTVAKKAVISTYGISFPGSDDPITTEYTVNAFDDADDDDILEAEDDEISEEELVNQN